MISILKDRKKESEVTQSCPTLCDPIDCSLPGSSVHGICQARVLEWGASAFSAGVGCHFLLQCVKVKSLSHVRLLATPWTAAYQGPPSMGFSRQEYWSRLGWLPFPSPGDLSDPGIEPMPPAWQADSLPLSHQGSPFFIYLTSKFANCLFLFW